VLGRRVARRAAGDRERRSVRNHVVGCERDDLRVTAASEPEARTRRQRRPRIAARRLQQDVGGKTDLRQLFGHQEPVIAVGDHDRTSEQGRIGNAQQGFLEGGMRAE
jgi:hypothetical protein